MNPGPAKYDNLDYTPAYGAAEMRGDRSIWSVDVSIKQGRAMEADGIPVYWIYMSVPKWVVAIGLTQLYSAVFRLWTWPQRLGGRGRS